MCLQIVSKFAFSGSQKLKIFSPRRGGASRPARPRRLKAGAAEFVQYDMTFRHLLEIRLIFFTRRTYRRARRARLAGRGAPHGAAPRKNRAYAHRSWPLPRIDNVDKCYTVDTVHSLCTVLNLNLDAYSIDVYTLNGQLSHMFFPWFFLTHYFPPSIL